MPAVTIRLDRPATSVAARVPRPPWLLAARPASPAGRILLVAVNLAVVTSFLLSYSRHGVGYAPFRIDLDVYRIGGRAWLRHGDLYWILPLTSNGVRLPFTYPPVAAVLFSPLSLVPMAVAGTVLSLVTIGLAALVLLLFLRSAAGPRAGSWRPGRGCRGPRRLRAGTAMVVPHRREPRDALGPVAAGHRQLVRDPRHRHPACVRSSGHCWGFD
jgi:hypothetical protein